MKWARFAILLVIVTLLNSGNLLNLIAFGPINVRPDLLLILLVYCGTNSTWPDAMIAGFWIGVAADVSGVTLGPHMIVYSLFGAALCQLRKVVVMKQVLGQMFTLLVAGIISGGLVQALILVKMKSAVPHALLLTLGVSFYSAGIGPIVWGILKALAEPLGLQRRHYGRPPGR